MRGIPVAAVLLLAACASPGAPGAGTLDGRTFLSTQVTEDGRARPLVEGTQIRLTFEDGRIGAHAGCNSMGATYRVDNDVLVIGDASTTEIGCEPRLHEQDEWLLGFLGASPSVLLEGDDLTLSGPGVTIRLLDRRIADPDRSLIGTQWVLDTIIEGQSASSVPAGVEAWIEFTGETTMTLHTGCNQGGGEVEVRDATITFEPPAITRKKCTGPEDDVEQAVLAVLDGTVPYTIEAAALRLGSDARGLIYRER